MKYCDNYLNWLQFPNSKKNSFRGNYMRKYSIYSYKKSTNMEVFQKIGNLFLERLQNVESILFCLRCTAIKKIIQTAQIVIVLC